MWKKSRKIGTIIQARTSSTRLPRKVLKELPRGSGITVLQQIIRRLKRVQNIHEIIVATSTEPSDDEILTLAQKENTKYFRGSLEDVLGRYYGAAKENSLDVIVRITGDCPCVDSEIVNLVIERHLEKEADYTSNVVVRSYARGFDVEVFNFRTLEQAYKDARGNYQREHVTVYMYEHPEIFKIVGIEAPGELYAPDLRVTLDTIEDYVSLCDVFDNLYSGNEYFGAREILNFFKQKSCIN